MESIFSKVLYEIEKGHDLALITIVASNGSTPRKSGTMMLVNSEGPLVGTIGGGVAEEKSVDIAKELISKKTSKIHSFRLYQNDKEDIGAVCGGEIQVLIQFIDSKDLFWNDLSLKICKEIYDGNAGFIALKKDGTRPTLIDANHKPIIGEALDEGMDVYLIPIPIGDKVYIFGAGHCAKALVPILSLVGFCVTVYDDRPHVINKESFPYAKELICAPYEKAGELIHPTSEDYVVIMTEGHVGDYIVEIQMIKQSPLYLGLMGSKNKISHMNEKLRRDGIDEEKISLVHTPIGLDIGAVTPEEIAISIAGEIIEIRAAHRNGK